MPAIRFFETCGFMAAGKRQIYAPHGKEGGPPVALVYTPPPLVGPPRRGGRHRGDGAFDCPEQSRRGNAPSSS